MGKVAEIGIKCLKDEAQAILSLVPTIGNDFERAVKLILECKGRVVITGVGKSGHVASKMAATFASTGTPSFYVNTLDAYHGDLGMFCPEDVVITISYSGNTFELTRLLPSLLNRGIPIIAMTSGKDSVLAQNAACWLNIGVEREACPLNLSPTSSTTVTLALGDALACALIEVRNFKASDFAKFHPGGSLGKHLSKVHDYMTTDNLPIVTPTSLVSDAMIVISNGKHGLAVVVYEDSVVGIVTDGDIRRAMQVSRDRFFDMTVEEIMNKAPKTIYSDEFLSKAEQIMQEHRIYALVVVDEKNRIKGLINSVNCL
ncbi:MAG: KpsF/GutQ family sugar-phosphate isomerase [Prevotellaceae bacterium]|nr:KpsF/GutQ family sugar-phosphate isomerase [Prevotellaceae bacterium]